MDLGRKVPMSLHICWKVRLEDECITNDVERMHHCDLLPTGMMFNGLERPEGYSTLPVSFCQLHSSPAASFLMPVCDKNYQSLATFQYVLVRNPASNGDAGLCPDNDHPPRLQHLVLDIHHTYT